MKRNEIKILVVEDDVSQGRALQEGLSRRGYQVTWVTNPDDGLQAVDKMDLNVLIADCLLPKMNGVDLAESVRRRSGAELVIILYSGIYRDKTFTREALNRTQAAAFLSKPLDLEAVYGAIEEALGDELEPDLPPLLETLTVKELNHELRLKALGEGQSLHGFDLPLLYSMLFGSDLTGRLTVMASDGSTSNLSFREGRLTHVHLLDKTSYFGALLVEMGFTSEEELQEALRLESSRPIGERLVASHSLSPHAIRIVRQEQMVIRLSMTIQDQFVEVSWAPIEIPESEESIDRERFTQLVWDWICSKTNTPWLQETYGRWLDYPVELSELPLIKRRLGAIPGLEDLSLVLKVLGENSVLGEALEAHPGIEDKLYPILHLLLIEKLAKFNQRRASKNTASRNLNRIKKLIADAKQKDHFQILGISVNSGDKEINRAYLDLAKAFHPDRLPPGTSPELKQVTEQYFAIVSAAADILKNPTTRAAYIRELNEGSAEKILQTESQFEQGQALLRRGKFSAALDIFAALSAQRQHRADLPIYLAWAKLKVGASPDKIAAILQSVGDLINRVPPEERHSANYFYVKALYYHNLGDYDKAKTHFKHALMMDPKFVEARRDLSVTRSRIENGENERTDFSTVVTRLFTGKRKTS